MSIATQTRTRVYANIQFSLDWSAKTRFVKIQEPKVPTFYRLVIADVGNAFIRPTEDGTFQATLKSRPMDGFHGKTVEAVWNKLAKHIGETGELPAAEEAPVKAKTEKVVKQAKPAKVTKVNKTAAKKVVAKPRKSTRGDFDFEALSENM